MRRAETEAETAAVSLQPGSTAFGVLVWRGGAFLCFSRSIAGTFFFSRRQQTWVVCLGTGQRGSPVLSAWITQQRWQWLHHRHKSPGLAPRSSGVLCNADSGDSGSWARPRPKRKSQIGSRSIQQLLRSETQVILTNAHCIEWHAQVKVQQRGAEAQQEWGFHLHKVEGRGGRCKLGEYSEPPVMVLEQAPGSPTPPQWYPPPTPPPPTPPPRAETINCQRQPILVTRTAEPGSYIYIYIYIYIYGWPA